MKRLTLAASLLLLAGATPAMAQDGQAADSQASGDKAADSKGAFVDPGGERVNQLIVYGDDPCPPSTGDEITVCARKEESERYRIPEILRQSDSPANEAWSQRVENYETVGAYGTMSCSPSGYGGWTGCTQQLIDAAYKEKHGASDVHFSDLIQEERAKRLSTIDKEAAEEQARVEQLEKEYEAKLAKERETALPDETPSGTTPPADPSTLATPPQD